MPSDKQAIMMAQDLGLVLGSAGVGWGPSSRIGNSAEAGTTSGPGAGILSGTMLSGTLRFITPTEGRLEGSTTRGRWGVGYVGMGDAVVVAPLYSC